MMDKESWVLLVRSVGGLEAGLGLETDIAWS